MLTKMQNRKNKLLVIVLFFALIVNLIIGVSVITSTNADAGAPEIVIDYGDYTKDTLPKGFVGSAYKVFGAGVYDADDEAPTLKIAVYKNYSIPTASYMVNIYDGKFTPESTGYYAIEYTATNRHQKSTTVVVPIEVVNVGGEISVSAEEAVATKQGEAFVIPTATASGDATFGKVTVRQEIYFGGEKIADYDGSASYTPQNAGTYTVKYIAEDYAGRTKILEKTVTVARNTELIVYEDITNAIPKYIVDGSTYFMPELKVYEFGEIGATSTPCEIYVDGVKIDGNSFVANVSENGKSVVVKYEYKTFKQEFTVKGIKPRDESGLLAVNLFVPTNASVEFDVEDKLNISAQADGKVDFANPFAVDLMGAIFSSTSTTQTITFTMVDAYNPAESVALTFKSGALSINGAADKPVPKAVFNGTDIEFTVLDNKVTVGADSFLITTFENGAEFTGFSSRIVRLSITSSETTTFKVSKLASTYLSPYYDYSEPKAFFVEDFNFTYLKDNVFELPAVIVSDFVDGITDCELTVLHNGAPVSDVNGTVLNGVSGRTGYTLILDDYGEYYIKLNKVDNDGMSLSTLLVIRVRDDVKPEISVNGIVPETGKVGTELILPDATAADNIESDLTVYALVIDPNGIYEAITDFAFTPDKAGVWKVRYYCYDLAGNLSYLEYEFTVVE